MSIRAHVDMEQLCGRLALVAVGRRGRLQSGQLAKPDPGQGSCTVESAILSVSAIYWPVKRNRRSVATPRCDPQASRRVAVRRRRTVGQPGLALGQICDHKRRDRWGSIVIGAARQRATRDLPRFSLVAGSPQHACLEPVRTQTRRCSGLSATVGGRPNQGCGNRLFSRIAWTLAVGGRPTRRSRCRLFSRVAWTLAVGAGTPARRALLRGRPCAGYRRGACRCSTGPHTLLGRAAASSRR
jgi:hypothetical protein